ncbi:YiiX/YebB-like N1pC/P60 family cysteine hydrolase [Thalassoglobus polymorphus]|uniref:Permuted papain-like amidase enzyme, YaeF/YiiX, C92 family n=1 Tax=Thalassoglobus polymorphus TaxID=2527994 RepID=A0A517QN86_9PLAN|nr:YiiX/YebB-like N1pC/P60 family cysteine hydrolase [Thalassoglobus polymorphus]QDT33037.1 hypothetical protein Mal48_22890 [Thalassoglobus polymorphus]
MEGKLIPSTSLTAQQKRKQKDRQIFAGTLLVCGLVALIVYGWAFGPAYRAYWIYKPQEGDIIFQSLPRTRLVNAIEGVSDSPYSHCGIISKQNGKWVVYEAFRDVEMSPLREFIFRGRNQGFAVYRFRTEFQKDVPATIKNVKTFLGRPYDARYRMDDEAIYCSELIYKAYENASGQQLGPLVKLGDLNWSPYQETIKYYEAGPVPLNREMITPKEMAQASQLELVFAHAMKTYQSTHSPMSPLVPQ